MNMSVSPTEVKMTPDGQVNWHVHDVAGGKFYTPLTTHIPDDPLAIIQAYASNPTQYEVIGYGGEGAVKNVGNYAVKHYLDPTLPTVGMDYLWSRANPLEHGTLQDLRANVALTEGLKMAPPLDNFGYSTRGVEIYGSFVPDGLADGEGETIWLMEKLDPVNDDDQKDEVIRAESRNRLRKLYFAALLLVGVQDYEVELDDCSENIILTSLPQDEVGELVKIDSYANEGWLNF